MESYGKLWKVMESYGILWKIMEDSRNKMEDAGKFQEELDL
jgi:hypothetical protein